MAIHPTVRNERATASNLTQQDISAWTEQAAASLQILDISDSVAQVEFVDGIRDTSTALSIPLDEPITANVKPSVPRVKISSKSTDETTVYRRREPLRRDSLKRREAFLKGKEGSRRRQRWENDRLLSNPWAQPPAPGDWSVQPTHPRHDPVPYYLAPLWDSHFAHKEHSKSLKQAKKNNNKEHEDEKSRVSKEIRKSLKHARAARGMLQDLEEDIRRFLEKWNDKQLEREFDSSENSEYEDSDEEIVFVGRNGQMHDARSRQEKAKSIAEGLEDGQKMVFESLAQDPGAVFGRWLVHSIATYYGLYTWSVSSGTPERRQAYVGLSPPASSVQPPDLTHESALRIKPGEPLPKPLWVQI
ncbi:hypothetical protein TMatcc_007655 [Talaromyces marneffei ATCC 18224]|uniref:R3H domain-containing protein n=1 Tax=Talaromyces marneffei (strain ATCC 18224 / CBS 334.59 / QM 7333) TaxID=441960 RepID=B6QGG7_TALMQ|nr:uncharacterized protein EYB26_004592 [Talaromyces marneffei]EEA24552.1 conserved hypothetical protein [Talaromyces marneffei ATCC 18224]KAE8552946.1 hypothetical protein EYB25_004325 [Talaromyces marneffei]QGA16922.1 hypothetical protein EYB26_004592 [Talaromyces marneffei]